MVIPLAITLGTVTLALIALAMYRAILVFHENDSVILDRFEAALETERAGNLRRIQRVESILKVFTAAFVALAIALAIVSAYQALYAPHVLAP
jgi:hypothetical protein